MTDARGVKYYVKYSLGQYEGPYMKEFPIDDAGKRAIESFLNEYAGNPDFKCQVIWGHEIGMVEQSHQIWLPPLLPPWGR